MTLGWERGVVGSGLAVLVVGQQSLRKNEPQFAYTHGRYLEDREKDV